jgi:alginate O-acetyltransferase complex protein AlgI
MKLQELFLVIVFLTTPLIWRIPVFWKANCMAIITLLVLSFVAPLSVLIMLLVAISQWLIWQYDLFPSGRTGFKITCILPLLPLVFYKTEAGLHQWLVPLGLSFYSFRQVHVAFEVYKGQMQKPSLVSYFQYLFFLPVMLIGPAASGIIMTTVIDGKKGTHVNFTLIHKKQSNIENNFTIIQELNFIRCILFV